MGANIKGAGTDVIRIKGVDTLHGTSYAVVPDMIEAGTYMFAAAATKGDVLVKNVIPKHLEAKQTPGQNTRKDTAVPGLPDRYAAADRGYTGAGKRYEYCNREHF